MKNSFSKELKALLADEAAQSEKLTQRRQSLTAEGRAEAAWVLARLTEPQFWTMLFHANQAGGRSGYIGGAIVFRSLEKRKILRHVHGTARTSELTGFGWDVAALAPLELVFEEDP